MKQSALAVTVLSSVMLLGSHQQATSPATAPEHSGVIVFASDRDGDFELYRINPDGSDLKQLTDNQFNDSSPAWSPDGRQIAFSSDRNGGPAVFVMNHDGTSVKKIAANATPEVCRITWSPDGQRLAFDANVAGRLGIWCVAVDGSGAKRLIDQAMWPDWSPDGKTIVFNRGQLPQLWVMNADGSNPRMLLKDAGDMLPDLWAVWSPDGARILFTAVTGAARDDVGKQQMTYEVRTVSADGDDVRPVTKLNGMALCWSPDAKKIVVKEGSKKAPDLHIMTIGNEESTPLAVAKGSNVFADWTSRE